MQQGNEQIRVWDPLVRIGHWTLVSAFFLAYLTEDGRFVLSGDDVPALERAVRS